MDENLKLLVTIIGAGGGTAFVTALISGVGKWRSGAARREQVRNTSLSAGKAKAERERDDADIKRREAEEHVSILKRQLIELGVDPHDRVDLD